MNRSLTELGTVSVESTYGLSFILVILSTARETNHSIITPSPELNSLRILLYLFIFRFGLVSLFNGISTFVGYLMPKLFS